MGTEHYYSETNKTEKTGVVNIADRYGPHLISPGYGYTRKDVKDEYIIKVKSSVLQTVVRALIQDKISTRVTANWEPIFGSGLIGRITRAAVQAVTAKTLGSKYVTRRIWFGTSPLMFSLGMKFEAYEDPLYEVVLPCVKLQQMGLPASGPTARGLIGEVQERLTLIPPGPSPFSGRWRPYVTAPARWLGGAKPSYPLEGDEIDVTVGNFLFFHRVVLRDVTVEYSPKFTEKGYPISSIATIQFETFEIVTKEDLVKDKAIYKNIMVNTGSIASSVVDAGDTKGGMIGRVGYPDAYSRTPGEWSLGD